MHYFESAGFGGLCAVLGGALAFLAARTANTERRRNDDLVRWWERFTWTVDNVSTDDELLYRLVARLSDAADRLGDPALVEYMQEFTLEAASEAFGGESHWTVTPRDEGIVDDDR